MNTPDDAPTTNGQIPGGARSSPFDELRELQERARTLDRAALGTAVAPRSRGASTESPGHAGDRRAAAGVLALSAATLWVPYLLLVLGDDLRAARGLGSGTTSVALLVYLGAWALAAGPAARLAATPATALPLAGGLVAVGLLSLSLANGVWQVLPAAALSGAGGALGLVASIERLIGLRSPEKRYAMLVAHRAAVVLGSAVAFAVVALFWGAGGASWRLVTLALAVAAVAIAAVNARVAHAEGRRHEDRWIEDVLELSGAPTDPTPVSTLEAARRVWAVPTVRWVLAGNLGLGLLLLPLAANVFLHLEQKWGTSALEGASYVALSTGAAGAVAWIVGQRLQRHARTGPTALLTSTGSPLMLAAVAVGAAPWVPWVGLLAVLYAASLGAFIVAAGVLDTVLLAVVTPRLRLTAITLAMAAMVVLGTLAGFGHVDAFAHRFGRDVALATLALPALHLGLFLRRHAADTLDRDLDAVIDHRVETAYVASRADDGHHLPLLACRDVDFSYGQLQVLFGVDFTIDEGEMVALLGTNGAGKSTLLKVISGLGVPERGSVWFRGEDVTYLEAERRVERGITQVPGGRAVFPSLSVVDNLRMFGFAFGKDRRRVEQGIEASLAAFPALAARRSQPASTLSGGEQQMLGLSRALILEPRLLLIDELSLGLAPRIVGELLEMVRRINATGTAVVLVEQSVNVALSLVDHAYFMEKGEMRFDGPAAQLLERDDLLRSVFLEGATH